MQFIVAFACTILFSAGKFFYDAKVFRNENKSNYCKSCLQKSTFDLIDHIPSLKETEQKSVSITKMQEKSSNIEQETYTNLQNNTSDFEYSCSFKN